MLLKPQGHAGFHVLWCIGHLQDRDCDRPLLPVHVIAEGFAGLGLRADRSACHCAVVARYSRPPLRVDALRRSSREIVEAARPSRRATSCIAWPCARRRAISSRSANER